MHYQPGERLTPAEAADITYLLGITWHGNTDHNNANTIADKSVLLNRDPADEPFVQKQIERSVEVIEPYIGRIAVGTTGTLVLGSEDDWTEVDIFDGSNHPPLMRAIGKIRGIEGHDVAQHPFHDTYDGLVDIGVADLRPRHRFRIGLILDDAELLPDESTHHFPETPPMDSVMIPINDFRQRHSLYLSRLE